VGGTQARNQQTQVLPDAIVKFIRGLSPFGLNGREEVAEKAGPQSNHLAKWANERPPDNWCDHGGNRESIEERASQIRRLKRQENGDRHHHRILGKKQDQEDYQPGDGWIKHGARTNFVEHRSLRNPTQRIRSAPENWLTSNWEFAERAHSTNFLRLDFLLMPQQLLGVPSRLGFISQTAVSGGPEEAIAECWRRKVV